jgi:hypothetical protein
VHAARFTLRWWNEEGHVRVWAGPRARLAEAAALLRLGDRAGAEAAVRRVGRDLDRPDPDLPWLPELRGLRATMRQPAAASARASTGGASGVR